MHAKKMSRGGDGTLVLWAAVRRNSERRTITCTTGRECEPGGVKEVIEGHNKMSYSVLSVSSHVMQDEIQQQNLVCLLKLLLIMYFLLYLNPCSLGVP